MFRDPGSIRGQDFQDLYERLCYGSTIVVVSGFDRSIADKDVKRALWKHFSEFGDIILVDVKKRSIYDSSYSYSKIYFEGDIAEEEVMAMSGRDIGGWTVVVDRVARPQPHTTGIDIRGFDTSLTADEKEKALREHFSSCGKITDVSDDGSCATIHLYGEDHVRKAKELDGSYMGGFKISLTIKEYLPITDPIFYTPFC